MPLGCGLSRLFSGFGLTLWRPWDWAILHAGKDVENRDWLPWPRVLGRHIAVHSGLRWDAAGARDLRQGGYPVPEPEEWPGGLIRGVVRVAGTAEQHWSEWFGGPIGGCSKIRFCSHSRCPAAERRSSGACRRQCSYLLPRASAEVSFRPLQKLNRERGNPKAGGGGAPRRISGHKCLLSRVADHHGSVFGRDGV